MRSIPVLVFVFLCICQFLLCIWQFKVVSSSPSKKTEAQQRILRLNTLFSLGNPLPPSGHSLFKAKATEADIDRQHVGKTANSHKNSDNLPTLLVQPATTAPPLKGQQGQMIIIKHAKKPKSEHKSKPEIRDEAWKRKHFFYSDFKKSSNSQPAKRNLQNKTASTAIDNNPNFPKGPCNSACWDQWHKDKFGTQKQRIHGNPNKAPGKAADANALDANEKVNVNIQALAFNHGNAATAEAPKFEFPTGACDNDCWAHWGKQHFHDLDGESTQLGEESMKSANFMRKTTNHKPYLIIHIGPSKTATSTIQRECVNWTQPLLQDSYVYMGKFADPSVRGKTKAADLLSNDDCFKEATSAYHSGTATSFRQTPCWDQKMKRFQTYFDNHQHILLSDEGYSYVNRYSEEKGNNLEFYSNLRIALEEQWSVLVVPTYRRYFDWILSVAKERNRRGCLWDTATWPHQNGKPCNNLWKQIFNSVRAGKSNSKKRKKHRGFGGSTYNNLDVTLPIWEKAGFTTRLLDFHAPQHITCNLFCNVIPNAPKTCQYCNQQPHWQLNAQSTADTAYNEVLFEAAQRGILDTTDKGREVLSNPRWYATDRLVRYHAKLLGHSSGMQNLPLHCPEQDLLEEVFHKSWNFHQLVFADKTTANDLAEHGKAFWKLAHDDRQFCHVNFDVVLKDSKSWEDILKSFQNAARGLVAWPIQYFDEK